MRFDETYFGKDKTVNRYSYLIEYDLLNRPVSLHFLNSDGVISLQKKVLSDNNHVSMEYWSNGKMGALQQIVYSENNLVLKKTSDNYITFYSYDKNQNNTKNITFIDGHFNHFFAMEYDRNGINSLSKYQNKSSQDQEIRIRENKYDDKDNLINQFSSDNISSNVHEYFYEYVYN